MLKIFKLSAIIAITGSVAFAQKSAPENWFNLDAKKNKVPGVSSERAYTELLTNKKSTTIVVAVIDGGTEVVHEDLKNIIWVNEKEIPGNNIDDDNNGYVDDINGWSFLGGPGGDVVEETLELTRIVRDGNKRFVGIEADKLNEKDAADFKLYQDTKKELTKRFNEAQGNVNRYKSLVSTIGKMQRYAGSENPTAAQLADFTSTDPTEMALSKRIVELVKKGVKLPDLKEQIKGGLEHFEGSTKYHLNIDFDPRNKVGDNPNDATERFYGCNRVSGPKGDHGTHVAGIIAAARNNNIGMNGVADNVKIMVLRVVPDGDERDKDIANAIRYAADNGAKIINMSFGKGLSPQKNVVDEAVEYAVQKGVLLVHAAGNDNNNIDTTNNFPRAIYLNNSVASSWLEVGASNWKSGKNIPADFSNYGKQTVDVFAPGVDIYSCIPESKYASFNGTSMASPVTAGVAALIWSYYPQLNAVQVKDIIMKSVVPVKGKVLIPGTKKKIKMTELCKTGGIVNAYQAIKLADNITNNGTTISK
jgi:subtilisin family serine protease